MKIKQVRRAFRLEECQQIYQMLQSGRKIREIGRELNRNHGTISKFIRRNSHPFPGIWRKMSHLERAKYAFDKQSERKRRVIAKRATRKSAEVWDYVCDKLVHAHWSPELIAGKLKVDIPGSSISFQCIYNMIRRRDNEYLKEYLFEKGKKRRSNVMGRRSRFKEGSPDKVNIRERSEEANLRTEPGHLEIDCIVSCRSGKGALANIVDRFTREAFILYVDNLEAETVRKEVVKKLLTLPVGSIKSITLDNGTEFSDFFILEKIFTGLRLYWCDPYKPQQRGTVERSNRNFRRFFPKGTDFSKVSQERLEEVMCLIRNMPLKLHGFRTPGEVLIEYKMAA
jgi:IS30 family transposase